MTSHPATGNTAVSDSRLVRLSGVQGSGVAFLLSELARGENIARYLPGGLPQVSTALSDEHRSGRRAFERQLLVVCPDIQSAEEIYDDLQFFLARHVSEEPSAAFPVVALLNWEVLPFDGLSPPIEATADRIAALSLLASHRPLICVTTIQACMQRLFSPQRLADRSCKFVIGQELSRESLVTQLHGLGYRRASICEERGQFAVRGAVVDLFPPGFAQPIRLELFAEVLESIRFFDASSQRSLFTSPPLPDLSVLPVTEFLYSASEVPRLVERFKNRARELELPERVVSPYIEALQEFAPYPGMEQLLPLIETQPFTLFDYLDSGATVVVRDELAVRNMAEDFEQLVGERSERAAAEGMFFPQPSSAYATAESIVSWLQLKAEYAVGGVRLFQAADFEASAEDLGAGRAEVFNNSDVVAEIRAATQRAAKQEEPLRPLIERIKRFLAQGMSVGLLVAQKSRSARLRELLQNYDLGAAEIETTFSAWQRSRTREQPQLAILHGILSTGLRVPSAHFVLFVESEIFPGTRPRQRQRSLKQVKRFLGTLSQLKEGDIVVHTDHGIGSYKGLKQLVIDGVTSDFLELHYAEGAKLFLPVENIGKVQKYVGAEGIEPELSRLGTKQWEKQKEKVRSSVTELAGELLNLYAARSAAEGVVYGPVNEDDQRFADTFGYTETADQQTAIADVLADMARAQPMDRLVCGDVGYGKTEVAMRAAFKAANTGKQVALLVPTTILADQHFANFKERFADFPLAIGCVSRFFSSADNRQTLERLAAGRIDIIIGTHRLLQKDVVFKDLGLIIIDEEHRFGVAHKEKLKKMRKEVDVLTLTATPIPRTLHMSLMGIRDLSVIETPPSDRQVIRTYIAPYSDTVVREAILRELNRSGQVFYIHNRVQNIEAVTAEVRELVSEARVEFAHGQMAESELESVMHRFVMREIDVLVCTTIVESGVDIPNANTIIIRKADMFGLAELYQLRGRVGRSSRRAYAYLLISDPRTLGHEARKRLAVLESLDDLGQGFRLALQDMEIRGAGNLLGKDQTGHVAEVGYDLYTKILQEAVFDLKTRREGASAPRVPVVDPEIAIGFPAHIPTEYVPDVSERLILYQRLVELRDEEHGAEILEEIEDRFGHPPESVLILVELMVLKSLLRRAGVTGARYRDGQLSITFHPEMQLDPTKLIAAVSGAEGNLKITPDRVMKILVEPSLVTSPRVLSKVLLHYFALIGCA